MPTLDLHALYDPDDEDRQAKFADLPAYESAARAFAEEHAGEIITLTGAAPIWLYLKIAHALHGRARTLIYEDGMGNRVEIFNHDPT